MHKNNAQERNASQQIILPIFQQSDACATSVGETNAKPGTCMDKDYPHAMQPELAPHINSGHYVQPACPQPKVASVVNESHNTLKKEVNPAVDQATPVQYFKDIVPAQTMNRCTNATKCNGKLLQRSESSRREGAHSRRFKNPPSIMCQ